MRECHHGATEGYYLKNAHHLAMYTLDVLYRMQDLYLRKSLYFCPNPSQRYKGLFSTAQT